MSDHPPEGKSRRAVGPGLGRLRVSSYNSKALLTPFQCNPMAIERNLRSDRWAEEDEAAESKFKALTREEAQALRAQEPPLSPWRVIGLQAAIGTVAALLAALFTDRQELAWSVLYGAATVVVPGALMARGMTSPLSSLSPGASAGSVMFWASVKILVSVVMLILAPKLVQPLSWPALLVGLVLCMKVYVVALMWRGRRSKSN
jgi:ATP synthase protein I